MSKVGKKSFIHVTGSKFHMLKHSPLSKMLEIGNCILHLSLLFIVHKQEQCCLNVMPQEHSFPVIPTIKNLTDNVAKALPWSIKNVDLTSSFTVHDRKRFSQLWRNLPIKCQEHYNMTHKNKNPTMHNNILISKSVPYIEKTSKL